MSGSRHCCSPEPVWIESTGNAIGRSESEGGARSARAMGTAEGFILLFGVCRPQGSVYFWCAFVRTLYTGTLENSGIFSYISRLYEWILDLDFAQPLIKMLCKGRIRIGQQKKKRNDVKSKSLSKLQSKITKTYSEVDFAT